MEQISAPAGYERAIAAEELARFPGWAPNGIIQPSIWDDRIAAEWQEADLILAPSPHLIKISEQFGADRTKFQVIPYPATVLPQSIPSIRDNYHRTLRIIFAGTLMLQKGVQYIYEALRQRPDLPVQMDFFGPVNLTPLGVQRLREVGTVHGLIARSQLHDEYRKADVLLFPSLSEGHALVMLEAAALGLPVIATRESGASSSAMLIPTRSPEAIIEAIETLVADRENLYKLSAAGLADARARNLTTYAENIVGSLLNLVSPSGSACGTSDVQ
jgi:glycosyltransferase involved in cell wall biosynthesis